MTKLTNDHEAANVMAFDDLFRLVTGHAPFPWQKALFNKFMEGRFPKVCNIPTGLGKTSIIAIWLLALAHHVESGTLTDFPRRLVYVVNRRTVVDQATREAEDMRAALGGVPELQGLADILRSWRFGLRTYRWRSAPYAVSSRTTLSGATIRVVPR